MKKLLLLFLMTLTPLFGAKKDRVADTQAAAFVYVTQSSLNGEGIWDISKEITEAEQVALHKLLQSHVKTYKSFEKHNPKVLTLMQDILQGYSIYILGSQRHDEEFNTKWFGKKKASPASIASGFSIRLKKINQLIGTSPQ